MQSPHRKIYQVHLQQLGRSRKGSGRVGCPAGCGCILGHVPLPLCRNTAAALLKNPQIFSIKQEGGVGWMAWSLRFFAIKYAPLLVQNIWYLLVKRKKKIKNGISATSCCGYRTWNRGGLAQHGTWRLNQYCLMNGHEPWCWLLASSAGARGLPTSLWGLRK